MAPEPERPTPAESTSATHGERWSTICQILDQQSAGWRKRIADWGQLSAVEDRSQGRLTLSNDEVFRGIILSVLSSNTVWERIERIQDELEDVFFGYSIERYAALGIDEVKDRIVPWFESRGSGSAFLGQQLVYSITTAKQLLGRARNFGSIDQYIANLFEEKGRDAKQLAIAFGYRGLQTKLHGLGVPLAAEALKNLGYDVAKPDRHIKRAVGSFGWVQYRNWKDQARRSEPKPLDKNEFLQVMTVMEEFAQEVGETTTLVDNAIWMLCSQNGQWLTNAELRKLGN